VQKAQVDRELALEELPRSFFDRDFDPVRRLLVEMPLPGALEPSTLPESDGSRPEPGATPDDRDMQFADWYVTETTRADLANDAVQGRLSRAIMDNYAAFVEGMQLIQGVEASIERALGLAGIASRRLASGRKGMVVSGLTMVRLQRRRQRLAGLRLLLARAGSLAKVEGEVTRLCDETRFVKAVRTALSARDDLAAHAVAGLTSLEQARDRVGSGAALLAVRIRLDAAVEGAFATAPRDMDAQASGLLDPAAAGSTASPLGLSWSWEAEEGAIVALLRPAGRAGSAAGAGAAASAAAGGAEEEAEEEEKEEEDGGGVLAVARRRGGWSSLRLCRTLAAVARAYSALDDAGVEAWAPEEAAARADTISAEADEHAAGARGRRLGRGRATSTMDGGAAAAEALGLAAPAPVDDVDAIDLSEEGVARALDMASAAPAPAGAGGTAADRIRRAAESGPPAAAKEPVRLVDRLPDILASAARMAVQRLTKEAVVDASLARERRAAVASVIRRRQLLAEAAAAGRDEAPSRDLPAAARRYLAARKDAMEGSTFAERCKQLRPEALVAACVRACGAVTSVLFAHSCALQWARSPLGAWLDEEGLSEREVVARLFRLGVEEEGDGDGAAAEAAAASGAPSSSSSKGRKGGKGGKGGKRKGGVAKADPRAGGILERLEPEEEAALASRLAALRPALLRSRAAVWQTAQQRVGQLLLEAASSTGAATRPYLAVALAACRDLARVGTEYVGSSAGSVGWSVLRDAAAVAASRATASMVQEAAGGLRSLLAGDAWQLVPIQGAALRGVLAAVKRRHKEPVASRLRAIHAASGMGGGSGVHALAGDPTAAGGGSRSGGGGGGGTEGSRATTGVSLVRGLAPAAVLRLLRRKRAARDAALALTTGSPAAVGEGAGPDDPAALAVVTSSAAITAVTEGASAAELDAHGFLEARAGRVFPTWASAEDGPADVLSLPTLPGALVGSTGWGNPFGCFSDGGIVDEVAVAEATAAAAVAVQRAVAEAMGPAGAPRARGRASSSLGAAASASAAPKLPVRAIAAARAAALAAIVSAASAPTAGAPAACRLVALRYDSLDDRRGAVPLLTGPQGSSDADLGRAMAASVGRGLVSLVPAEGGARSDALRPLGRRQSSRGAGEGEDDDEDDDEAEADEDEDDDDEGAGPGEDDEDSEEELRPGSLAAEERADKEQRARRTAEARAVVRRVCRPIATAAALNGVARSAGKFVSAMEVLPGAAPDALRGLGRLFDAYLIAVATTFLPPAALRAVCASPAAVADAMAKAETDPKAAAEATAASRGGMGSAGGSGGSGPGTPRRGASGGGRGGQPAMRRGASKASMSAAAPGPAGGSVLLPVAAEAVVVAYRTAVAVAKAREDDEAARRARRRERHGMGPRSPSRRMVRSPSAASGVADRRGREGGATACLGPVEYGEEGTLSHFLATHARLDHARSGRVAAVEEAGASEASRGGGGAGDDEGAPRGVWRSRHPFGTLREELRRIASETVGPAWEADAPDGTPPGCAVPPGRLPLAEDLVDMRSPREAPGMASRCVAAESLGFCLEVLFTAAPRVAAALPASHAHVLRDRLVRAVTATVQLRGALFAAAAGGLGLGLRRLSERMAAVDWNDMDMAAAAESAHVAEAGATLERAGEVLGALVGDGRLPECSRVAVWGTLESRVWGEAVDGFAAVTGKTFAALGRIKKDNYDLHSRIKRHGPAGVGGAPNAVDGGGGGAGGGAGGVSSPRSGPGEGAARPSSLPAVSPRGSDFLQDWVNAMVPEDEEELVAWAREHAEEYSRPQLRSLALAGFNPRGKAKTRALVDRLMAAVDA